MVLSYLPQVGFVRATRPVLAALGTPLQSAPGPNRAVKACRETVWAEAAKLGAREIEAVSARPEHLNGKGQFVGRVRIRVTYERWSGKEVREITLTCVVGRDGAFIDATKV